MIKRLSAENLPRFDVQTILLFQFFKISSPLSCRRCLNVLQEETSFQKTSEMLFFRLIPKSGDSSQLKHWRPINLMNAECNIFVHVLANCLKLTLRLLKQLDQIAYLKGAQMTNANILLKSLCEKRTKGNHVIATLDFCKTCD